MGKNKGKKEEGSKEGKGGKGKAGKEEPPPPQTKGVQAMEIRHILVEKQKSALEILEAITSGKITFNEAARQFSLDKAGRSGLLGWKRKDELDPDFWEAALQCPEGDFLRAPVRTQWGWHLIQVQARK